MYKILIIDDDQAFRVKLKRVLEGEGYEVEDAGDGQAGLAHYRQHPTDLVVTDIIMPNKEGLETIVELRKEFPSSKIIAISGGGRNCPGSYLDMADVLGANLVYQKPFDLKDFLAATHSLLTS